MGTNPTNATDFHWPKHTIRLNRMKFGTFSWQGQAPQYDQRGAPNEITYRRFIEHGYIIDTLLSYNEDGFLVGLLNYYPQKIMGEDFAGQVLEQEGNVNVFVHPEVDHDKVYADLLREGKRRWGIDGETPFQIPGFEGTLGGFLDGNRRVSALLEALNR